MIEKLKEIAVLISLNKVISKDYNEIDFKNKIESFDKKVHDIILESLFNYFKNNFNYNDNNNISKEENVKAKKQLEDIKKDTINNFLNNKKIMFNQNIDNYKQSTMLKLFVNSTKLLYSYLGEKVLLDNYKNIVNYMYYKDENHASKYIGNFYNILNNKAKIIGHTKIWVFPWYINIIVLLSISVILAYFGMRRYIKHNYKG